MPLRTQIEPILKQLAVMQQRVLDACKRGSAIANERRGNDEGEGIWRQWNQSLPPIAFEILRETKELLLRLPTAPPRNCPLAWLDEHGEWKGESNCDNNRGDGFANEEVLNEHLEEVHPKWNTTGHGRSTTDVRPAY